MPILARSFKKLQRDSNHHKKKKKEEEEKQNGTIFFLKVNLNKHTWKEKKVNVEFDNFLLRSPLKKIIVCRKRIYFRDTTSYHFASLNDLLC